MANFPKTMKLTEFDHPNYIDQSIINTVSELRNEINRPFFFSAPKHPGGDARFIKKDERISSFSLHYVGINHVQSAKMNRLVRDDTSLCRALDFSMKTSHGEDFCNVALWISDLLKNIYPSAGLGMYPMWSEPGFHVDTRPPEHPSKGARWWAETINGKQIYHNFGRIMSYSHLKEVEKKWRS